MVTDAFVRLVASAVWDEARDRRALWFRAVAFETKSLQRSAARRRAREATVAAAAVSVAAPPTLADEQVIACSPEEGVGALMQQQPSLDVKKDAIKRYADEMISKFV